MATKKRKGIRAKKEKEPKGEVVLETEEVAAAETQEQPVAPVEPEIPAEDAEPEQEEAPLEPVVVPSELGMISITPRAQAFLARLCEQASPDNPLTPEQAVADILDEWVNIYEHTEDGGIETAIQAAVDFAPEPDDPEVLDALEEQLRS